MKNLKNAISEFFGLLNKLSFINVLYITVTIINFRNWLICVYFLKFYIAYIITLFIKLNISGGMFL